MRLNMTKLLKLLAAVSGAAAAVLGVTPAFAAGTAADTNITNQASVGYSVGGVSQTAVLSNTDTFKVDRVIKLRVEEAGTTTTGVSPGQTAAVTTFNLYNDSNAPMDVVLSTFQQTGGAGAHSNTDNFDMTAPAVYVESGANVGYQPLEDLAPVSGYIDELAADGPARVIYVVANVPAGRATGDVAAVDLIAQAHLGGTAGAQGTAVNATNFPQNVANGITSVENVMSDTTGSATGDVARDGRHSAKDDYTVSAAALTVTKTSRVVWDPVNLTSNPKAIPGARVEYCIAVTNAAGGAAATSVAVSDTLVSTLAPYGTFGYWTGATVTSGVCSGGTNNGSATGQVVSGTIGTVAAGSTSGFYFQATVQ
jgi:hypothetical protein